MPQRRSSSISSNTSFKNSYRPGKARISEIIDFGTSKNNRYLKINQTSSKTNIRSNSRHLAAFKNPLLNSYDDEGEEDYEPKHFVFDFDDDTSIQISRENKKPRHRREHKSGDNGENKRPQKETIEEMKRRREREKKEMEILENARRLKEFEENERIEKLKRKERTLRREKLRKEKEDKIRNRNNNLVGGSKLSLNGRTKSKIDQKKVGETVKMIEQLLKESKVSKHTQEVDAYDSDKNNYYDVIDINRHKYVRDATLSSREEFKEENRLEQEIRHQEETKHLSKEKSILSQREKSELAFKEQSNLMLKEDLDAPVQEDGENQDEMPKRVKKIRKKKEKTQEEPVEEASTEIVTEQEKQEFFNEKNIVVNLATDDAVDTSNMTKKPVKKHVTDEISAAQNDKIMAQQDKILAKQEKIRAQTEQNVTRKDRVAPQNNMENISVVETEKKMIKENLNPRTGGTQTIKDVNNFYFFLFI